MTPRPAPSRRIICATSVIGGQDAFNSLGNTVMVPESEINRHTIRDADALITRSKVKINDDLLEDSRISFYGTATAGTDHVDIPALERRGIAWTEAAGSNANSVAEYVLAALSWIAVNHLLDWTGKTIGIIGAGHVGSRLAELAAALGLNVILNDPPLHDATGDGKYIPLHALLNQSDIVTMHVPLTRDGMYPTAGMAGADFFSAMKPGAVFINASRGEVVDETALRVAAIKKSFFAIVLDVFDHEPDISIQTLKITTLGTPHVAGYSYDARLKGTEMVYASACRHFGVTPKWKIPANRSPQIAGTIPSVPKPRHLYEFILAVYDPGEDDLRLRALPVGVQMRHHFHTLRQSYPERREFSNFTVTGGVRHPQFAQQMKNLGFQISSSP